VEKFHNFRTGFILKTSSFPILRISHSFATNSVIFLYATSVSFSLEKNQNIVTPSYQLSMCNKLYLSLYNSTNWVLRKLRSTTKTEKALQ